MSKRQTLLRKLLSCGLIATALAVTAVQASAQDGVTVRGSGTCREYLDAAHTSVEQAMNHLTWLLGYLSGLAVATQVNVLGKNDNAESMLTWVNTYCQAYPAKYLSNAGDMYYRFRIEQMKAEPKSSGLPGGNRQ
jgi:hypothetical protein